MCVLCCVISFTYTAYFLLFIYYYFFFLIFFDHHFVFKCFEIWWIAFFPFILANCALNIWHLYNIWNFFWHISCVIVSNWGSFWKLQYVYTSTQRDFMCFRGIFCKVFNTLLFASVWTCILTTVVKVKNGLILPFNFS